MMKETERVRGGDVVGGRLLRTTSVYVFSPGRGEQPLSQHSPPAGGVDHTFRFGDRHSRYQSAKKTLVPESKDMEEKILLPTLQRQYNLHGSEMKGQRP